MKKLEKGELVCFKCTNPAVGWVVRVAKDGSWADVEWLSDRKTSYVKRYETKYMYRLNPIFNRIANERGFLSVFLPEAYT